ncbi:Uncharacterized protein Rs2_29618 [Raphanus sativus]|nr:Uncharacterized protein Rs2_29618 [Raphanus sativus]
MTKGEDSNAYQGLVITTKAGMHEKPHNILNRISNRASARFSHQRNLHKDGLYPSTHHQKNPQNLHKKANNTTAGGTMLTSRHRDVSYDEMLTQRWLMTPENRLSI